MNKFLAFFTKAWYWIRNPSRAWHSITQWFLNVFHYVKHAIVWFLHQIWLEIVYILWTILKLVLAVFIAACLIRLAFVTIPWLAAFLIKLLERRRETQEQRRLERRIEEGLLRNQRRIRQQQEANARLLAEETLRQQRQRQQQKEAFRREHQSNLDSLHQTRRQKTLTAQTQLQRDKAFQRWRDTCKHLLKPPATITKLPRPPSQSCSNKTCQATPLQLEICTHVLKDYYKRANLNREALKKERNFWHPNGRKWNKVAESERIEAKAMAGEVSKVLLEVLDEKRGAK